MSSSFKEAQQVRLSLKMTLSKYHWYRSSDILANDGDYYVRVVVNKIDDNVRKIISPVINGVAIKAELANHKR